MTPIRGHPHSKATAGLLWLTAVALIAAIFVGDTITRVDVVVSMLYVAPVLLVARVAGPVGILSAAATCALLATLSVISRPPEEVLKGEINLFITFAALATIGIIAIQGRSADARVREQAGLLDMTHDSIFVRGMDGVIRYWNRGAEELYGWSADDARGKISHELLQTQFPASLEAINTELLQTGRWEGELRHTPRDAPPLTVASRWFLQRDAQGRPSIVLEINNDVTSRSYAEYLMGEVFNTVCDAMGIFGADFRVQLANEAYARNHRRTPKDVVGVHLADLNGREIFEQFIQPNMRRCLAGEDVSYAGWWAAPAGRRYVRVSYSPLRPNSEAVEAVLMVAHDLTVQMTAAEALREAQADLAHANRVATAGQLTATIAHEVNQPIHAAAMSAQAALRWLAAEPPDVNEARDALTRVVRNTARAGEVLGRIRSLVKKSDVKQEHLDLVETIREVVELTHAEMVRRGVRVEVDIARDLPPLRGDRVQLQQVILNLVMNGLDAMAASPAPRRMVLSALADGARATRVAISDTGPGVPPDLMGRLFEPFFTTKSEGMGMGLAICRSIVEAHGGRLWATANEPHGARFQFTLPAAEDGETGGDTALEAQKAGGHG